MKKLSRVMIAAVLTMVLFLGGVTEAQAVVGKGHVSKYVELYSTDRKVVLHKGTYDKIYAVAHGVHYMSYDVSGNYFYFDGYVLVDSYDKCHIEVQVREKINGVYTAWNTVKVTADDTYVDHNVYGFWDMKKNASKRTTKNGVAEGILEIRYLVHRPIKTGSTTTNITTVCPGIVSINYTIDCNSTKVLFRLSDRYAMSVYDTDKNVKSLVSNVSRAK